MRKVDHTRIPFAKDGYGAVQALRLSGETPHTLVVGGSQTGKTSLLLLVAAVAAGLGMIVIVFDPKWQWKGVFHRIPHVVVYDEPDEYLDALQALGREMKRRYVENQRHQIRNNGESISGDRTRFPAILLIADEYLVMGIESVMWWENNKEWWTAKNTGDDKVKPQKKSPFGEFWVDLVVRGAGAGIVLVPAVQNANASVFPGGTINRGGLGQRIVLGVGKEDQAWSVVMGREYDRPPTRADHQGAGAFLQGTRMHGIQVIKAEPHWLAPMAAKGLAGLRENGHIEAGRLTLHSDPAVALPRPQAVESGLDDGRSVTPVSLVRPGANHGAVQVPGQDTGSSSAGDPDSVEDEPALPDETREEPSDTGLMLIGYPDAAAYIATHFGRAGYTAESFRKDVSRKGVDLPNEGKKGNQTVWTVDSIRAWHRAAFPKREGE